MTNYRAHALMMRIPYGSHRRTRVSRPVWVPEKQGGPGPGRRTWPAMARDIVFGILLILTLAASISGWKRPSADEPDARIETLIRDLKAGDPEAKRAAAEKLGEMGASAAQAVPALTEALDESQVCFGAQEALKRIQSMSGK